MNELVSVIIPCYKQAQYVREAVLSALAQEPPVEVIVVDDCDPDVMAVPKALYGIRSMIKIHRNPQNLGLAQTRNEGIARAVGKFILPLDSDDNLHPLAVQRLRAALLKHKGASVAYGDLLEFGEKDGRWSPPGGWSTEGLIQANKLPYASLFYKADWEEVEGYDAKMRSGFEDYEFWVRLAAHEHRFVHVPEITLLYRKHGESMIDSATQKSKEILNYMRQKHKVFLMQDQRALGLPISWDAV